MKSHQTVCCLKYTRYGCRVLNHSEIWQVYGRHCCRAALHHVRVSIMICHLTFFFYSTENCGEISIRHCVIRPIEVHVSGIWWAALWGRMNVFLMWTHDITNSFDRIVHIFVCKVNIWNANCARVPALIFDSRTVVLEKWKCRAFETEIISTPNHRMHTECSNHMSYRDQTFPMSCFRTLDLVV